MVFEVYFLLVSLSITKWDLIWPSSGIWHVLHLLGSAMTFTWDLTWLSYVIWPDLHLLGSDMTLTCWDLTWPSPAGIWHDIHLLGFDMIFTCWDLTWFSHGIWPTPDGIWYLLKIETTLRPLRDALPYIQIPLFRQLSTAERILLNSYEIVRLLVLSNAFF